MPVNEQAVYCFPSHTNARARSSLRSRKDEQRAVTAELPIPGQSKTKREGGKKEQQKAELKDKDPKDARQKTHSGSEPYDGFECEERQH